MFSRSCSPALLLACAAISCSDPSSDQRLELAISNADALVVELGCAAECAEATLTVALEYPAESFNPADTIQLLQYRVDYELPGSKAEIPYYAEPLSLVINPDELRTLTLTAAGAKQREQIEAALGSTIGRGNATLQLAGYDWDNRHVFVRTDFEVRFRRGRGAEQVSDDSTSP
jgi:hypothetical protein